MAARTKYLLLQTGRRIPAIGYGTYLSPQNQTQDATEFAIHLGYRHIDTAVRYENETEIGQAIRRSVKLERVQRKDMFVTTKVPATHLAPNDVEKSIRGSLERLQLRYVDLLLIHQPWGKRNFGDGNFNPVDKDGNILLEHYDLNKTWKALESAVAKGQARAIGFSNFNERQIKMLKDTFIKPACLQLECHAYLQQSKLRKLCADNRITVTGYSPLGSPGRPLDKKSPDEPDLLADNTVLEIAKEMNATPAQILIKFLMQIGVIPLVKSVNPKRMQENFEAQFLNDLSDEHMKRLAELDRNYKYFSFTWAKGHPEYDEGLDF